MKKVRLGNRGPSWCWEDENGIKYKECAQCNTLLELCGDNFYKQKTTKSGFRSACKTCHDNQTMKKYRKDPQYFKEAAKKWKESNPQRYKEYLNRHNQKKRDKRAALSPEELKVVREIERLRMMDWKKNKCTSGVYTITNKINDKVYVGESYAIENRWNSHRSSLKQESKCNSDLLNDWKTYGEEAFEFKIIKKLTDSSKEVRLIEEEKTILDLESQGVVVYNSNDTRRRIM